MFQEARRKAWASIMMDPDIQELINEQKDLKRAKLLKMQETTNILDIYK